MVLLLKGNMQLIFYLVHGLLNLKMAIALLSMMKLDRVGTFFHMDLMGLLVQINAFSSLSLLLMVLFQDHSDLKFSLKEII